MMEIPTWDVAVYYAGTFTLFTWAIYLLQVVGRTLLPGTNLRSKYQGFIRRCYGWKQGHWSGLCGRARRQGLNLILIARTMRSKDPKYKDDTLIAAKEYIEKKYPDVDNILHQADLGDMSRQNWDEIATFLSEVNVAVLVNNAGISYESAMYFTDVDPNRIDVLINLNVSALTRMTRIVLDMWTADGVKGDIINVTSYAGTGPAGDPLYAVYSGTKAYVAYFSRSLHHELKSKGINVECHVPHFVASRMSRIRRASLMAPSPKAWARAAVSHVGRSFAGPIVTPYWFHAFCEWVLEVLPDSFAVWFS